MSPISVTSMQPSVSTVSALHQLPTVITKPKIMVTNAAQMVLNGPSHTVSNSSLTNGAHTEIKKENSLSALSFGKYSLSQFVFLEQKVLVCIYKSSMTFVNKQTCLIFFKFSLAYHKYATHSIPIKYELRLL